MEFARDKTRDEMWGLVHLCSQVRNQPAEPHAYGSVQNHGRGVSCRFM